LLEADVQTEYIVYNAIRLPPNMPMQLTPLRVREILAFLKVGSGSNAIPLYRWRRN
jgi:hypothetical protein